jgi:RNA polymerase sigma-70 factor (ECF subfamily)
LETGEARVDPSPGAPRSNQAWRSDLTGPPERREAAIADLRQYVLRAVLAYLLRRRSELSRYAFEDLQQMAEDWAQLASLRVLDQLDSFRGDSRFTTWAYRVAVNTVAGELRRRQWTERRLEGGSGEDGAERDLVAELPDPGDGPEQLSDRSDAWEAVRLALTEDLTDRQREVLTRVVVHGAAPEDVAADLETNRNNIYKLLHDARARLRKSLARRGWQPGDIMQAFDSDPLRGGA